MPFENWCEGSWALPLPRPVHQSHKSTERKEKLNQGVGDVANLEALATQAAPLEYDAIKTANPLTTSFTTRYGPLKNHHPGQGLPLTPRMLFGPLLCVSFFLSEFLGVAPCVVDWEKTPSSHAHLFQSSLRRA